MHILKVFFEYDPVKYILQLNGLHATCWAIDYIYIHIYTWQCFYARYSVGHSTIYQCNTLAVAIPASSACRHCVIIPAHRSQSAGQRVVYHCQAWRLKYSKQSPKTETLQQT